MGNSERQRGNNSCFAAPNENLQNCVFVLLFEMSTNGLMRIALRLAQLRITFDISRKRLKKMLTIAAERLSTLVLKPITLQV